MLDSHLHPRLKPLLNAVAGALDRPGISPDGLTLVGFAIGVLALPFLALGWYGAALAAILLNRLLDGLGRRSGAAARAHGRGRLSRYCAGFSLLRPGAVRLYSGGSAEQCPAGGWLLFAFIGTGSSFLALPPRAASTRSPIPATPINRCTISGTDGGDGDHPVVCPRLPVSGAFRPAGVAVWRAVLADDGDAHLQWLPDLKAGNDHSVTGYRASPTKGDALRRGELLTVSGPRSPRATGLCGLLLHSYQPPSYTATWASPWRGHT